MIKVRVVNMFEQNYEQEAYKSAVDKRYAANGFVLREGCIHNITNYDRKKWGNGTEHEFETLRDAWEFMTGCDITHTGAFKKEFTPSLHYKMFFDTYIYPIEPNTIIFCIDDQEFGD